MVALKHYLLASFYSYPAPEQAQLEIGKGSALRCCSLDGSKDGPRLRTLMEALLSELI